MRIQLVVHCVDQRVQTAAATTTVVHTPAAISADVCTAVGAAAPSTTSAGGAAAPPGMGSGSSAVGLDRDLTAPTASHWAPK